MSFYDDADFQSSYLLKNCTLRERYIIGIVKEDDKGSSDGWEVMLAVFKDISERFNAANAAYGQPVMKSKIFDREADLDDYVSEFNYPKEAMCFAMQWQEFNVETKTFDFAMRMNHGETLANRYPQTHYEESIANQLYLEEYSWTGML